MRFKLLHVFLDFPDCSKCPSTKTTTNITQTTTEETITPQITTTTQITPIQITATPQSTTQITTTAAAITTTKSFTSSEYPEPDEQKSGLCLGNQGICFRIYINESILKYRLDDCVNNKSCSQRLLQKTFKSS